MARPNDDRNGERRCRDCGQWKPLDDFCTNPRRPSGRGSYCKLCFNVRSKASYTKRVKEKYGREVKQPQEVPDGHRYCPGCSTVKPVDDFVRTKAKRSGFHSYCKPCHKEQVREAADRLYGGMREYHLRERYGIGQKEFEELLAAQDGVCAICMAENPEHVDHDHKTGYIRGILCFNCNGGLGHFGDACEPKRSQGRDNIVYLSRAMDYLRATAVRAPDQGGHRLPRPRQGMFPVHRVGARRPRRRASLASD